jgi:hypothetical protein
VTLTAAVGQQAGEEGVAGDVEGHAEAHVARPLVHQAGQLAIGHVELKVARFKFLLIDQPKKSSNQ